MCVRAMYARGKGANLPKPACLAWLGWSCLLRRAGWLDLAGWMARLAVSYSLGECSVPGDDNGWWV